MKRLPRRFQLILIASGVFISVITTLWISLRFIPQATPATSPPQTAVLAETTTEAPLASPAALPTHLGIVLFGYGGAGHDGGYLTDAIQVLYIDSEKGKLALIALPRDLWVSQQNGVETKINAVLASAGGPKEQLVLNGAAILKHVIAQITGLEINYFVGIDFVGFQRAIGINLKGVDVSVAQTLEDPWYPIPGEELATCGKTPQEVATLSAQLNGFELERQFPCRYEHLLYKQGLVHMEGGDALKYVRSRHGSTEGDISRGRRQQEVLKAIRAKLFSLKTIHQIPDFFSEISVHTKTDIDLSIVTYLLPIVEKGLNWQIIDINPSLTNILAAGTSRNGAFIINPKAGVFAWKDLQQFIQSQLQ
jgi:anionic cell wall polymer biosynthesis LytR-Cps2A-Psr (LCP) family protein